MSWNVTASDINNWSTTNTRLAQETLPLLIRKLILATVNPKYIHFPSGDSVLIGGWDGVLEVDKGNAFIPEKESVWEFGTNYGIHSKAEADYKKRTDSSANMDITYIFATTRTWSKKDIFEKEKNAEKRWKRVKGINSDDLEAWLSLAPSVHRWFARLIGKRPSHSLDIEEAIEQWSCQTKVKLNTELLTVSREEKIKELHATLSRNPSKIIVVSNSEQESYAFVLAALNDEIKFSSRVLIVKTQEAWDELIQSDNSLILLYKEFTPTNIGVAINNGHFVIEAQETTNLQDSSHTTIELSRVKKSLIASILEKMGFGHKDAWEIYSDTKGFLHAIVRHPKLVPLERIVPSWVSSYSIDILSTILFINSWNRSNSEDTKIIESFSRRPYDEFEKELFKLSVEKDSPIRLVGNIWQVISKINLWDLHVSKVSDTQVNKLEPLVIQVFSEIDPAFELHSEERVYARTYGKTMKYSGLIRESLADTLALLATFGEESINYPANLNDVISSWLKELFETNLNVEAWYSYGRALPLLAEASPESFLNAIEKTLKEYKDTKIEELFEDSGMMGGCFHCNLIWALEKLSWNTDFLPRVVLVLAQLSKLNIKSKMSNSPMNTLSNIFLGWINNSSVTHTDKIQILEHVLYKNHPEITWKLLFALLPKRRGGISSGIVKPKYHTWHELNLRAITQQDLFLYHEEISELLFKHVRDDAHKWIDVFNNIEEFHKLYFAQLIDTFITLDKSIFSGEERLKLTNKFRGTIHKHRKYPDTDWALPAEWIDKLIIAFNFIEPENLIDKCDYLFNMSRVETLTPIPYTDKEKYSYKHEEAVINTLRVEAITNIVDTLGFDGLISFIKKVSYVGQLGRIIYKATADKYQKEILEWLDSENRNLRDCAGSFVSNLVMDELLLIKLNDNQKGKFLVSQPFNSGIFEVLKKQSTSVQEFYWNNLAYYYRLDDSDEHYVNWILEEFAKFKQYSKAIEFFSHMRSIEGIDVDVNLLYNILIAVDPNSERLDSHAFTETINFLQKSTLENEKVQLVEWKYLKLGGFKPIHWEREILVKPSVFVQLVSWVYEPDMDIEEDIELTQEQISNRASNARELLNKMSLFTKYTDIAPFTTKTLRHWILEAQKGFKEAHRVKVGSIEIGKMMSKSPDGEDGIFPNIPVREILEEFGDDIGEQFCRETRFPNGFNSTSKAFDEGGAQEYSDAARYKGYADTLKFTHPQTSHLLKKLSHEYEQDGKCEDLRNELS